MYFDRPKLLFPTFMYFKRLDLNFFVTVYLTTYTHAHTHSDDEYPPAQPDDLCPFSAVSQ